MTGVEGGNDGVEIGNDGVEIGNDGVEIGNDGAIIAYFSLTLARARLKRTTIAPIFPFLCGLCAFAPLRQIFSA